MKPIETTLEIQTSDWKTFGKAIKNYTYAVMELIDNSIEGIRKADAYNLETGWPTISIEFEEGYILIKDTGCGMTAEELISSMGYGKQLPDNVSMICFAGTGSITSTAYINRENDDWEIYSRKNGVGSCLKAPWRTKPNIFLVDESWPYGQFNTVRRIKVSKDVVPQLDEELIAKAYGFTMDEMNLRIVINGKRLFPCIPHGTVIADTRNNPIIIGEGHNRVEFSYIQFDIQDESQEYECFTKSYNAQGLYYVFNGRYIMHTGLKMLSDYSGKKMRDRHPSLNGKITFLFYKTFSNESDCLTVDSQKTNIDFSSAIGKAVARAICEKISPFYREDYAKGIEAENKWINEYDYDTLCDFDLNIGGSIYLREVYVCSKGDFGLTSLCDIPHMDGVYLRITDENYLKVRKYINNIVKKKKKSNPEYELNPMDLTRYELSKEDMFAPIRLIEFKNMAKGTKDSNVQQLIGYADYLRIMYNMKKDAIFMVLIGGEISPSAQIQMRSKQKDKYNIVHRLYGVEAHEMR